MALIYLAFFLFFIYKNAFFGLFRDEHISKKQMASLFFLKTLAIPVFYVVYKKFYGGLEGFDAGIFYDDAKAVHLFAQNHFKEYLKLMFGLQDDSPGSYIYSHCLVYTHDWDNGKIRDFFYNDNRVVIRIHSLLHFIAFNSYFVHALFSCFLSFVGVFYLYRSLKLFFIGKELPLFFIFCFFPTLWFYTGAVSKESLALFVLGCSVYCLKKIIYHQATRKDLLWFSILLFLSFFLKPYLLCSATICFATFFFLQKYTARYRSLSFLGILCFFALTTNGLSIWINHRSLSNVAFARQRIFADAAKGGIFLLDALKFVRLDYDTALVKRAEPGYYTIKKNVPYMYWEHSHQEDTLFCTANEDTLKRYELVYELGESGSNFDLSIYSGGKVHLIASCFYYSLFYPLFFNAKGPLQQLASGENLLILVSLFCILLGSLRSKKDNFPVVVLLVFALALCALVGLTTPNSGAIFRYRSPAVIFILSSALYYWKPMKRRVRSLSLPKRNR